MRVGPYLAPKTILDKPLFLNMFMINTICITTSAPASKDEAGSLAVSARKLEVTDAHSSEKMVPTVTYHVFPKIPPSLDDLM